MVLGGVSYGHLRGITLSVKGDKFDAKVKISHKWMLTDRLGVEAVLLHVKQTEADISKLEPGKAKIRQRK